MTFQKQDNDITSALQWSEMRCQWDGNDMQMHMLWDDNEIEWNCSGFAVNDMRWQ